MQTWIKSAAAVERLGEIEQVIGLKWIANGPPHVFIGEVCDILDAYQNTVVQAEVIGFNEGKVHLMPYEQVPLCMGYTVRATGKSLHIPVGDSLLGQVVDAFAMPLNQEASWRSPLEIAIHRKKINPLQREPIKERILTGVQAIDGLLPIGRGQRIGIFAGSGVGKSNLLGKMIQQIHSDINVIALIGERGREVNEFIAHFLDESTRQKSILVVACSDDSALIRRQAAYSATAIAEFFCQQGKQVTLFMDSITRFAMAQREIGLSLGEPPTARGYTPSVFSLLPGLVERAGRFKNQGSITAIYTVLVEGDDFNEPLADHMRALLDGHIVLTRDLAQQGHYPAISILQSISRLSAHLVSADDLQVMKQVIALLNLYQQNKELVELGAYKPGTNLSLDFALARMEGINRLLAPSQQNISLSHEEIIQRYKEILL